jgi:hypothetical protein
MIAAIYLIVLDSLQLPNEVTRPLRKMYADLLRRSGAGDIIALDPASLEEARQALTRHFERALEPILRARILSGLPALPASEDADTPEPCTGSAENDEQPADGSEVVDAEIVPEEPLSWRAEQLTTFNRPPAPEQRRRSPLPTPAPMVKPRAVGDHGSDCA